MTLEGKTILLIDDSHDLVSIYTMALTKRKATVISGHDGKEGFDLLFDNQVDIVITDLMMPDYDGRWLIERIKERTQWNTLPIILLTGFQIPSDLQGKVSYALIKPVDPNKLIQLIEGLF